MVVGLLLLLVFCLVIVDRNLRSLRWLANFTALTTEGEFTDEVPDSKRPDEIGKLQRRFRKMQQALRQYTGQLRQETETLEQQNLELGIAYNRIKEEEQLKTNVLHQMSEEMEQPVRNILTEARAICDYHHDLTEEDFSNTVDDMLQSTTQVTTLLDKYLHEAQGIGAGDEVKLED